MSRTAQPQNADWEWEAQERACHEERVGAAPNSDPRVAHYRAVVRMLRDPAIDPIPHGFAATILAEIDRLRSDDRFESWLQRGLVGVFACVSIATLLRFSDLISHFASLPAAMLDSAAVRSAIPWSAVAIACLGISPLVDFWRRHSAR